MALQLGWCALNCSLASVKAAASVEVEWNLGKVLGYLPEQQVLGVGHSEPRRLFLP